MSVGVGLVMSMALTSAPMDPLEALSLICLDQGQQVDQMLEVAAEQGWTEQSGESLDSLQRGILPGWQQGWRFTDSKGDEAYLIISATATNAGLRESFPSGEAARGGGRSETNRYQCAVFFSDRFVEGTRSRLLDMLEERAAGHVDRAVHSNRDRNDRVRRNEMYPNVTRAGDVVNHTWYVDRQGLSEIEYSFDQAQ